MKSIQNAQERRERIRRRKKVYGVPKLPRKIDAMYENVCRGNLIAYYLDADPVRRDFVYGKLEKLKAIYSWDSPSGSEKVAEHFMDDMRSRQMREKTYNHIRRMPLWFLRLEFALKYETNRNLRREIDRRFRYMFRDKDKKWTD